MKRLIFILTLMLIFSHTGWSQINKFQIGIDGGLNVSSIRGFDQVVELEPSIGYTYSVTLQYNFSSKMSLVSGVGFEQKGFQTKNAMSLTDEHGNVVGQYNARINTNYINVPLMGRYTVGKKKIKSYVNLGGYLGFLLESYSFLVDYEPQEESELDNSDSMENIDFGFSAGLGTSYSVTEKLKISLELRNNLGLYNVASGMVINDGKNLLNSTNLLLGINYGFGAK